MSSSGLAARIWPSLRTCTVTVFPAKPGDRRSTETRDGAFSATARRTSRPVMRTSRTSLVVPLRRVWTRSPWRRSRRAAVSGSSPSVSMPSETKRTLVRGSSGGSVSRESSAREIPDDGPSAGPATPLVSRLMTSLKRKASTSTESGLAGKTWRAIQARAAVNRPSGMSVVAMLREVSMSTAKRVRRGWIIFSIHWGSSRHNTSPTMAVRRSRPHRTRTQGSVRPRAYP